MKLELKHLAGYLPYSLTVQVKHGWCTMLTLNDWSINGDCEESYCYETLEETDFKPILRPLSDLTKEINANGEKFVPIKEYDYLRFAEISTFKGGCNAMKFIQARELELLYEMHFDIYGLIDAGLAIDINTLNE